MDLSKLDAEDIMNIQLGKLGKEEIWRLLNILEPYAAVSKQRYIQPDDAQLMNKFLLDHQPAGIPGKLMQASMDSKEILDVLPMPERAKCLMEANGYHAVLAGEIQQERRDSGIIIFTPEGNSLITANQIWEEWHNKFSSDEISNHFEADEVKATENFNHIGSQEPAWQVGAAQAYREQRLNNELNSILSIPGQALDSRWNVGIRNLNFDERMARPDPQQRRNIEACGGEWCIYREIQTGTNTVRTELAVPSFAQFHPDLETFLDIIYWYKNYVFEESGKQYYEKSVDRSVFEYKFALLRYLFFQWKETLSGKVMLTYLSQTQPQDCFFNVNEQRLYSALTNFLGIGCAYVQPVSDQLNQTKAPLGGACWVDSSFYNLLFDGVLVEWVILYLGTYSGYQVSSALALLELIGKSFLGKNFRKDACEEKKQIDLVIAKNPESVAGFLQDVIEAGQQYFYGEPLVIGIPWNIELLNKQEEYEAGKKLLEDRRTKGSVVRSDFLESLMPQRVPAFIMDRYFGATVNIAADIGFFQFLASRNIDRKFLKNLLTGNRVTVPLWKDGKYDSKELAEAKRNGNIKDARCFAPMDFRSDMKYIFVTKEGWNFLGRAALNEKQVNAIRLSDLPVPVEFRENGLRLPIGFCILMLALYYVVDRRLLNKNWAQNIEKSAQENDPMDRSPSQDLIITRFWNQCCCDSTEKAEEGWKNDPELGHFIISDSDADKRNWQKKYGIFTLPADSREDIFFVFCLWCYVNHIKLEKEISRQVLMENLGKKLGPARHQISVSVDAREEIRSGQDAFDCRKSVPNKYYDEGMAIQLEQALHIKDLSKKRKGNQSRVYLGLQLNSKVVNELKARYNKKEELDYNITSFGLALQDLMDFVQAEVGCTIMHSHSK